MRGASAPAVALPPEVFGVGSAVARPFADLQSNVAVALVLLGLASLALLALLAAARCFSRVLHHVAPGSSAPLLAAAAAAACLNFSPSVRLALAAALTRAPLLLSFWLDDGEG